MAVDQSVASPVGDLMSPRATPVGRATAWLFTLTAFFGAALLFLVEPLVAKLLLPSYGGSATVWSTCTLFFQTLLLLAYAYSHWSTSRLRRPWQPRAHLLVLLLPILALPLVVPGDAAPPDGAMPAVWLIRTLALLVGLPFVVVATTGPLLQKWYSWTSGPRAHDPYFLFAASNLGSFVGLLAYPLWVEPHLTLAEQRAHWSLAYAGFLALTAACALVAARRRPGLPVAVAVAGPGTDVVRPSTERMLVWVLLAMLPSTLMLGVTTHLATDVASIPLMWVVPLALYLGSFVLAFARRSRAIPVTATRVAVALGLVEVLVALCGPLLPVYVSITTSLLMLATVAYAAHARLAVDRPDAAQLTLFYLVVAVGGVLGGLLNGLVAPALFSSPLEYPIALSAVPLLLMGVVALRRGRLSRQLRTNAVRATCIALVACIVVLLLRVGISMQAGNVLVVTVLLLVTLAVGWLLAQHPALALTAVLFLYGSNVVTGTQGTMIDQTRSFYGTYRVLDDGTKHTFVHGTTVHGTQFLDPTIRDVPTTYYAPQGPLGDVFAAANDQGVGSVGAVGLGTGTLAAYGLPGQDFTFFELDPEVVPIAENPAYFSYLHDSRASITTVTGDGRLGLSRTPVGSFDLIVLDAFSSDAIPVHLLTEEAITMYAGRLTEGGSLVFHISNRVFDLRPVLHAAADRLGWRALVGTGTSPTPGGMQSIWVVMGPANETIRALTSRPGWTTLGGPSVAWTDDYSSVLSVIR